MKETKTKTIKCSNPKCGKTLALIHEDIGEGLLSGVCPYCGRRDEYYVGIYPYRP